MITAIGYKSECMCHKKIIQACHQDQHKQNKRKDENNKYRYISQELPPK